MAIRQQPVHQWCIPTVLFGLSCGIGFFVAQQTYKERNGREIDYRQVSRRIFRDVKRIPLVWIVFLSWQSNGCALYPLTLWWMWKGVEGRGDDEENDKDETKPPQQSATRGIPNFTASLQPTPTPYSFIRDESSMSDMSRVASPEPPKRYLEMLVHNVSHTDLILNLNTPGSASAASTGDGDATTINTSPSSTTDDDYCMCRPRFSAFDLYSRRILESIKEEPPSIVSFPRYERSNETDSYRIVTPKPSRQKQLPTGFKLQHSPVLDVPCQELASLRVRGRDAYKIEPYCSTGDNNDDKKDLPMLSLDHVFFPLLATLLPRWHQFMQQKYSGMNEDAVVKKVIILVSGVGTPRNWTHSMTGNSTEACAKLMERFIQLLYPDVTIVRLHSLLNIFRYDENVAFCRSELRPCVDAYRDAHAKSLPYPDEQQHIVSHSDDMGQHEFSPEWKKSFHITLSFADGSPARTHAIQTSLRIYRPTYLHFWQLKSFWHATKLVDQDIELHSFEEMETVPALDASLVEESDIQRVIAEMKAFRSEFLQILQDQPNDVLSFWLRKTKKPVLAVLLVQGQNDEIGKLYRGTNMEVSMPTGSLCAERNVIGTALASNPGLKRADLKMVAVLAVPLPSQPTGSTDDLPVVTMKPPGMPRSSSLASYSSIVEESENEDSDGWLLGDKDQVMETEMTERTANLSTIARSPTLSAALATPPGTPLRRITLTSREHNANPRKNHKRTVLVRTPQDLNPLKPCGACNEWLKKIAESNPYFRVITFTDADCLGVYCSPCQE